MVEKIGLIKVFLFIAESCNLEHIFQTSLLASKTKLAILDLSPLLAASTACFNE
jgi:hypothetical protein